MSVKMNLVNVVEFRSLEMVEKLVEIDGKRNVSVEVMLSVFSRRSYPKNLQTENIYLEAR